MTLCPALTRDAASPAFTAAVPPSCMSAPSSPPAKQGTSPRKSGRARRKLPKPVIAGTAEEEHRRRARIKAQVLRRSLSSQDVGKSRSYSAKHDVRSPSETVSAPCTPSKHASPDDQDFSPVTPPSTVRKGRSNKNLRAGLATQLFDRKRSESPLSAGGPSPAPVLSPALEVSMSTSIQVDGYER